MKIRENVVLGSSDCFFFQIEIVNCFGEFHHICRCWTSKLKAVFCWRTKRGRENVWLRQVSRSRMRHCSIIKNSYKLLSGTLSPFEGKEFIVLLIYDLHNNFLSILPRFINLPPIIVSKQPWEDENCFIAAQKPDGIASKLHLRLFTNHIDRTHNRREKKVITGSKTGSVQTIMSFDLQILSLGKRKERCIWSAQVPSINEINSCFNAIHYLLSETTGTLSASTEASTASSKACKFIRSSSQWWMLRSLH